MTGSNPGYLLKSFLLYKQYLHFMRFIGASVLFVVVGRHKLLKLLKWKKLPINCHLKEFFEIDFSITICVSHCSHNINIPLCTLIYLAPIHFILCTRLTACIVSLIILYPPSFFTGNQGDYQTFVLGTP